MSVISSLLFEGIHLILLVCVLKSVIVFCGELTDHCQPSNFISHDAIKIKSPYCFNEFPDTVEAVNEGLYLMPNMNFTCSGEIKSILIGAKIRSAENEDSLSKPALQIWRNVYSPPMLAKRAVQDNCEPINLVRLVSSHTIDISKSYFSPTGAFYYYFKEPRPKFSDGDFIGYYQPTPNKSSVNMFFTNAPYIDQKTMYVDGSNANVNTTVCLDNLHTESQLHLLFRPHTNRRSSCMQGFLDSGTIKKHSNYINTLISHGKQLRLFPDIKFDCPFGQGYVTKVKFGAQTRANPDHVLSPELQIWRKMVTSDDDNDQDNDQEHEFSYMRIHSIPLHPGMDGLTSSGNNIHELRLNTSIQFQHEDFIGLFQPDVDKSRLVVFYQDTNGPRNFLAANGVDDSSAIIGVSMVNEAEENDYPLISVSVVMMSSESNLPSSSFSMNIIPKTSSATITNSLDIMPSVPLTVADSNGLIVTIAVTVGILSLVLLLITITLVLAVAFYVKNKQQKALANMKKQQEQQSNYACVVSRPTAIDEIKDRTCAIPVLSVENALTSSFSYDECVELKRNFSYGIISPKQLGISTIPPKQLNISTTPPANKELNISPTPPRQPNTPPRQPNTPPRQLNTPPKQPLKIPSNSIPVTKQPVNIYTKPNPSYRAHSYFRDSHTSENYQDYPEEYVLPMPTMNSSDDDETLSHKYY